MTDSAARTYFLIDHAPIVGGAELFVLRLADYIRRHVANAAVTIVCPRESALSARCTSLGLKTLALDFPPLAPRGWPAIPRAVADARRILRGLDEHSIVVCHSARASAYIAAAAATVRTRSAVVHALHEQETAARLSARFVFRRFGALVWTGGMAAGHAYEGRLGGIAIHRTNNFFGIEQLEAFVSQREHRPQGRNVPTIGVLARWVPEKGILELIEELAQVPESWSELLIAAAAQDAKYEQRTQERIASLGLTDRVELLGYVNDVGAFFNSIDALVVSSVRGEAQPTVILEALAYGCPCVVREPLWSPDLKDLPVVPYSTPAALGATLANLPTAAASPQVLRRRFGPEQALRAIDEAAATPAARSWHLRSRRV